MAFKQIISTLFNNGNITKVTKKYREVKKGLSMYSDFYWPMLNNDFDESLLGSSATNNIFFHNLFTIAFSSFRQQHKCYYLKENQSWEFGFIDAFRSKNKDGILIGFPHVASKFWDLRAWHDEETLYIHVFFGTLCSKPHIKSLSIYLYIFIS